MIDGSMPDERCEERGLVYRGTVSTRFLKIIGSAELMLCKKRSLLLWHSSG